MAQDQKHKVVVVVPRREFHDGYWSLGGSRGQGVKFPTGQTPIDVTDAELAELRDDEKRGFVMLVELAAGEKLVSDSPKAKLVEAAAQMAAKK